MSKKKKMYQCNVLLIIVGCLTIVSSILLECLHGRNFLNMDFHVWLWTHIVLSLGYMLLVLYHLYLRWGNVKSWGCKLLQLNSKMTKYLAWLSLFVFVTGIISSVYISCGVMHTALGGLHGKVGIIVIVLMIAHLLKRFSWFTTSEDKIFYPVICEEKCSRCGTCVKECPANVFEKHNRKIMTQNTVYCLQCKKCMLHCPKKAISNAY